MTKIKPMVARFIDQPFDDNGWIYEIDWGGVRAIAQIVAGKIGFYSNKGKDLFKHQEIIEDLKNIGKDLVLDGEIVKVKRKFNSSGSKDLIKEIYYVFDILTKDGQDLTALPLVERKKLLELLNFGNNIKCVPYIENRGKFLFNFAKENNMEGIIAKEKMSKYQIGGISDSWLRIKTNYIQEVVVCGYTKQLSNNQGSYYLILAVQDEEDLRYVGFTEIKFNKKDYWLIRNQLESVAQEGPLFSEPIGAAIPISWIQPVISCDINFHGWTGDGKMRNPVFIGLKDIRPTQMVYSKSLISDVVINQKTPQLKRGFL